jgi:hypothetical protein
MKNIHKQLNMKNGKTQRVGNSLYLRKSENICKINGRVLRIAYYEGGHLYDGY